MCKIKDIIDVIEEFAPLETQMSFDNCGLIFGYPDNELTKALITLDVTPEVVEEAVECGANLIISHHPLIFAPIKKIDMRFPTNRALVAAIKNNISIYASHTAMDFAEGGINDNFMSIIGAERTAVLGANADFARIGKLKSPCTLGELRARVAKALGNNHVLSVGDEDKMVENIGFICGAGASEDVIFAVNDSGADVFLTADIKYHLLRLAKDLNYAIIDFGHFDSEFQFESLVQRILTEKGFGEYVRCATRCFKPINN